MKRNSVPLRLDCTFAFRCCAPSIMRIWRKRRHGQLWRNALVWGTIEVVVLAIMYVSCLRLSRRYKSLRWRTRGVWSLIPTCWRHTGQFNWVFVANRGSTSWNVFIIWTMIMCFPRNVMTAKLPCVIKLDALLCTLCLHCFAYIIKLLPIHTNCGFKDSHFMRSPAFYRSRLCSSGT